MDTTTDQKPEMRKTSYGWVVTFPGIPAAKVYSDKRSARSAIKRWTEAQ